MMPSITVHQFPAALDMQPSAFGLKLETWLRMCGLTHDVSFSAREMGPKGKVPFATIDGMIMGDSELIIEHLTQKTGISLDDHLDAREKAKSTVVRRLTEEHLYHILVYSRWVDDAGWADFQPLFFGSAPAFIRGFISKKIRKIVTGNLTAQGIARHTAKEVYAKGKTDLEALSALLGDRPYFLGETPTEADASVYGLLANIYYSPIRGPLQEFMEKHTNLIRFCERIKAVYWPHSKRGGGEEGGFSSKQVEAA
ncbi:MAG: glutathione S-transferase family protein [Sneathiella sp.]|nr:glutathione S-transferase family protein [Sneathiella sp.]